MLKLWNLIEQIRIFLREQLIGGSKLKEICYIITDTQYVSRYFIGRRKKDTSLIQIMVDNAYDGYCF